MKKWENPELKTIGLDSTKGHTCHASGGSCPDYTNGNHGSNGHTDPIWSAKHNHTHCCAGIETPVPPGS